MPPSSKATLRSTASAGAEMVLGRVDSVGLGCALLHNAIMIGGDWLGAHDVVSSIVSVVVVTSLGYWLHSGWTFPNVERGGVSFARYVLTIAGNLPLSIVEVTPSQMVLGRAMASAARTNAEPFEVNFRSGLRIVVPGDFDGGAFERLLAALGAA